MPYRPNSWISEAVRHPYDTATGTIALGIALTVVLVLLLRQLAG